MFDVSPTGWQLSPMERTMSGAGRAQKFPSATSWRIDRSSSFLGQQLLQPGVPLLQLLEALGIHARQ